VSSGHVCTPPSDVTPNEAWKCPYCTARWRFAYDGDQSGEWVLTRYQPMPNTPTADDAERIVRQLRDAGVTMDDTFAGAFFGTSAVADMSNLMPLVAPDRIIFKAGDQVTVLRGGVELGTFEVLETSTQLRMRRIT
jgi:hypothetical protein